MELRSRINAAMKQAMKDKSTERLSTIRLIKAAIKDRDIAARSEGKEDGVGDDEVLASCKNDKAASRKRQNI